MIRKFKTLGVALFAVLAITAVSASAASATSYTAEAYPTTGTGESQVGNSTVTTEAGKVECKTHFAATLNAASSQLTVNTTSTGCRAFGFIEATVNMNSCDLLFTAPEGSGHNYSAKVDVVCPVGKVIEINAATCKLTISSQTGLSKVNISNNTAAGDVSVQANLSGINYAVTQDGFGCPFNGTGAKTGATLVHDAPITFDSTNGAIVIDVG